MFRFTSDAVPRRKRLTAMRTGRGEARTAASPSSDPGDRSTADANPRSPAAKSLSAAALHGAIWNAAQSFLNKLVTLVATFAIAFFLSPDDYGVAATALAVAAALSLFPPEVMADVLIAHPGRHRLLAASARRLALAAAGISALATWLAIPLVVVVYDEYPPMWLAALLAALALRPLCMAVAVAPLSAMRQRLQFRRIAVIDGATQFLATLLSVGCAALGARAASLVAPQLFNQLARAVCYLRLGTIDRQRGYRRKVAAVLLRSYLPASAAQYVHNVLVLMEVVVLGYLAGEREAGLFALAYLLATQANVMIAGRISMVLQSVFGHLQEDPSRHAEGFLRAQRVLAAACVPICLLQAAFAAPLFDLALADKWQPAVPVFQALSLSQAFYFAFGPCMAALKSQGRFNALLGWQGLQMLVSLPAFWFGARQGGAFGIAVASLAMWSISVLAGMSLCLRLRAAGDWMQVAGVFVRPWLVGLPVAAVALLAVQWLDGAGTLGDVVSLCVVAPALFAVAVLATRRVSSEFRAVTDSMWRSLRGAWR